MEAADKGGCKYLEENNQGVQIDSDRFFDGMSGNQWVATPRSLTDISPTGGTRSLALHFLLLVGIRR